MFYDHSIQNHRLSLGRKNICFSPVLLGETKIENEALRITVYIYTPQMVYSDSIQLNLRSMKYFVFVAVLTLQLSFAAGMYYY